MDVSIVIPLLNEAESLPELNAWLVSVLEAESLDYEIWYIDDGSSDESWEVIEALRFENQRVKGLRFQRNYGKSAALQMGFERVTGQVVITMDADLQDSPDEIPGMLKRMRDEGLDLLSGWKKKRYDPLSKTLPTKLFNAATRRLSGVRNLHDFNCGLKAYRLQVVQSIEVYGEMHRYIPVIAQWSGFKKIQEQVVQHRPRKYGHTKFGLERFVNGFLDLLSIYFISKFRRKPMHFFGTMGSLAFVMGAVSTAWLIFRKLYLISMGSPHRDVTDQPLFYLSLTLVLLGALLFCTGFLAELVARNNPDRNRYLVQAVLD